MFLVWTMYEYSFKMNAEKSAVLKFIRRNFHTVQVPYDEISHGKSSYAKFSGHAEEQATLMLKPHIL